MSIAPQDHQSPDFTYRFADGRTVTMARFKKVMTFGRARKLRKLPESEQMFVIFEEVCDEETLAALDDMDADETQAFFEAWQADSGVSLGESESSSN